MWKPKTIKLCNAPSDCSARGQDLVVSTNHAFAIQPIIFQIIF